MWLKSCEKIVKFPGERLMLVILLYQLGREVTACGSPIFTKVLQEVYFAGKIKYQHSWVLVAIFEKFQLLAETI